MRKGESGDAPFTEADWSDEADRTDTTAYERSKTMAERAAWAWLAAEGGGLELAAVESDLRAGAHIRSRFFSVARHRQEAARRFGAACAALLNFNVVDVRDIARLHVLAITAPEAAGQRFIGDGEALWMKDIAAILKKGLREKGRRVPTLPRPTSLCESSP